MSKTRSCEPGSYYDPNTTRCHPCSDCTDPGRPPNEFCTKTCITEKCSGWSYYDRNLERCFPCSDCEYPRTKSDICVSTCRNIQTSTIGPTTLTASTTYALSSSIIIPVCTIVLAVVLVIIAVFVYKYFGRKPRPVPTKVPHSGTKEKLLSNGGNTPPANGLSSITVHGREVTSPTSSDSIPPFEQLQNVTVTNAAPTFSVPRNGSAAYLSLHDVEIPRVSTPLLNEHPTSAITSDGSRSFQTSMIHSMPVTNPAGQSSARSTPSTRHVSFSQHVLSSNGSSSLEGSGLHSDDEGPIVTHPCENSGTCQFLPSKLSMPFSLS